jgi:hypothetical protein
MYAMSCCAVVRAVGLNRHALKGNRTLLGTANQSHPQTRRLRMLTEPYL